ncbi:pentatricopeptide repeat-containing protein At1g62680, mitochondrial-like [Pistacia vera]|uniref:pentatricopeptide repeat-containing protein At1g62680, mitochondrial-like n=1 Tax=Pistacia vera TaxID=55513 RepID=UPI001263391D|nr:pentatricopeptide repeat-containing protein At1g62680, mitochondrial-like [Pistacia vera]
MAEECINVAGGRRRRFLGVSDGYPVFGAILKLGFSPNTVTFTCLIKGKISVAIKLLEEMVNGNKESVVSCRLDVVVYTTLIDGLCKAGLVEKARQLFLEHMIQMGVVHDIYTYNIFMNGYCLSDRIGDVRELFDSITRKGYRPNVVCYTTLINWYYKNKEVNEAVSLYREMISEGIRPNVITYNTLLTDFFLIAKVKDARNLVGEMRLNDAFPNSWTYSIFIDGLCKNGCVLEALEMFNALVNNKIAVSIEGLSSLIDGLCKTGRFETAWDLFQKFCLHGNLVPDVVTYSILISGLC